MIKFRRTARTLDLAIVYCAIRINNMESKEEAAKLQLLVDEYDEHLKAIRNQKFDRGTLKKDVIKGELIEKRINILEDAIKKMEIDDFDDFDPDNEKLIELFDLENFDDEIEDQKLFKRENFKHKKAQSEKSLLYQFEKELKNGNWKEMFENEKRIVIVLDNARTHISKIAKTVAKILNIKLIFLEKYASDINPIEWVWYAIKDKLSVLYVENEMFLIVEFSRYFYKYANSRSLVEKWLDTYIS
ncbi:MAG: transposase [Methanobrevibacter sp.]|nr:transposase [Methanobrevibacter sp.]